MSLIPPKGRRRQILGRGVFVTWGVRLLLLSLRRLGKRVKVSILGRRFLLGILNLHEWGWLNRGGNTAMSWFQLMRSSALALEYHNSQSNSFSSISIERTSVRPNWVFVSPGKSVWLSHDCLPSIGLLFYLPSDQLASSHSFSHTYGTWASNSDLDRDFSGQSLAGEASHILFGIAAGYNHSKARDWGQRVISERYVLHFVRLIVQFEGQLRNSLEIFVNLWVDFHYIAILEPLKAFVLSSKKFRQLRAAGGKVMALGLAHGDR